MTHNLIDEIQAENNWRDGELATFKVNPQKVDGSLWNRMCLPMIYAHWEGYVVSSLKLLIDYLNSLKLNPSEVPTNLIVLGLGTKYNSLSGKQSFDQKVVFTDSFIEIFQKKISFKKDIDTKSNLNSNVLKELCTVFGFNFESFKGVIGDIDRIVMFRNRIAHGENSILPDSENIEKYIVSITQATDLLLTEIDNFVSNENFRLKNQEPRCLKLCG
ncbi:MAE_28990/MAE_18760 family HEPN-like nuclease [uncultured Shewanella sp.]|uniref:MAE_28990/MAE_18760 family HEPN-like nuclease n=1 Tax=uncultured Shewanella sp. TaxID=173975 RepID=UPI00261BAF1F|nr:MAE_28990/MAE_18760 family HEPN-like nuclease [uncultured Shewanella sp.]